MSDWKSSWEFWGYFLTTNHDIDNYYQYHDLMKGYFDD